MKNLGELETAAGWLANPQNSLFMQAQVNRVWYHLMGRGLVDPVDDFRATNPASHPELLKALAAEFARSGCDLRQLVRLIMTSRSYQLSSEPNETNTEDQANFSHAIVRRLSAEQLHDALHQFAGIRPEFSAFPQITRAVALPGPVRMRKRDGSPSSSDLFLRQFGQPPRLLACECERMGETTMGQAFTLMSSPQIDTLIRRSDNFIGELMRQSMDWDRKIEELYWRGLSRAPTRNEMTAFARLIRETPEAKRRETMEDFAWSLVNSKEFLLRR